MQKMLALLCKHGCPLRTQVLARRREVSTSETITFEKGPCPCGKGHIAQHVTSQDNPWSSVDTAYSIECSRCRIDWRLENAALVLRSSETRYHAAKAQEESKREPLLQLTNEVVDRYFIRCGARNKKAEHAEAIRLNITSMSYRQYLEHRRKGRTAAEACYGLRNQDWLLSQASFESCESELFAMISDYRTAKRKCDEASKDIIRRKVK
jgi:hypothetical protein